MALRSCAAGMLEAGQTVPPRQRHPHLPALRDTRERHVAAEAVSATSQMNP